jgi:hypothetical protein
MKMKRETNEEKREEKKGKKTKSPIYSSILSIYFDHFYHLNYQ